MTVLGVTTAGDGGRERPAREGSVRRRPTGRGRAVVTAGVAALALAGCTSEGGAAAVVDGEVIPVADVHAATAELRPYLEQPSPASILAVLVAEPTVARVAGEHGVAVSQQQVRDLLAEVSGAAAGEEEGDAGAADAPPPEFSEASLTVARFTLLQNGLQTLPDAEVIQEQLIGELDALDVDVNPRFGTIDFSSGGITPVEHPWLVAAPEAAAP